MTLVKMPERRTQEVRSMRYPTAHSLWRGSRKLRYALRSRHWQYLIGRMDLAPDLGQRGGELDLQ